MNAEEAYELTKNSIPSLIIKELESIYDEIKSSCSSGNYELPTWIEYKENVEKLKSDGYKLFGVR